MYYSTLYMYILIYLWIYECNCFNIRNLVSINWLKPITQTVMWIICKLCESCNLQINHFKFCLDDWIEQTDIIPRGILYIQPLLSYLSWTRQDIVALYRLTKFTSLITFLYMGKSISLPNLKLCGSMCPFCSVLIIEIKKYPLSQMSELYQFSYKKYAGFLMISPYFMGR